MVYLPAKSISYLMPVRPKVEPMSSHLLLSDALSCLLHPSFNLQILSIICSGVVQLPPLLEF